MVQGSIVEEPQKEVFEMYVICYLHLRIVSSVLDKHNRIRGTSVKTVRI